MFRIKVENAAGCEGTKRSIKQSVKRGRGFRGEAARAKTKKIKPPPPPSSLLPLPRFQKRVLSVRPGEPAGGRRRSSPKLLRLTSLKAAYFSSEICAVYHSLNTSFYARFMAPLSLSIFYFLYTHPFITILPLIPSIEFSLSFFFLFFWKQENHFSILEFLIMHRLHHFQIIHSFLINY